MAKAARAVRRAAPAVAEAESDFITVDQIAAVENPVEPDMTGMVVAPGEGDPLPIYEPEPQADPEGLAEAVKEALKGVIGRLARLADNMIQQKSVVEDRWLKDLRQYHARYEASVEAELDASKRSKLFVNLTRTKTSSWEARLSDLLHPTDEKNWGIKPTPVPTLSDAAQQAYKTAQGAVAKANALREEMAAAKEAGDEPRFQQLQQEEQAIAQEGTAAGAQTGQIDDEMAEATRRADLMQSEITDQLTECSYNIRSRDAIHDICKLGTGIMKGPNATSPKRRRWKKRDGTDNVYQLEMSGDHRYRPEYARVDPWNFFPDMSARTVEEAEFTFERHLWNAKDLKKAVRVMDLDPEEVSELLREGPRQALPEYWTNLREITLGAQASATDARYHVWEYHGSLDDEDIRTIANALGDESIVKDLEDNPLTEFYAIIWFCEGRLLKFGIHPLDSGESLYSVVPFERDDTSMFGFGVPYLMRDSQAALNAAWRMMMDNGGLSVGPQIVIDQDAIKPVDGDWNLAPMKQWLLQTTSLTKYPEGYKPFQTFEINSRQDQLQAIITLARQFADDETNMPLIAYGESASHITQTAQGMSMLMNSVNVVFRRVVKHFDDYMTVPNIRRLYDWNMQHSPRDDIKGDFQVDARGSSVLLVRELQAQNLMQMLVQFSAHPVLGPLGLWANAFRKLAQAHMITASEICKTDEVIEKEAQARAKQAEMAAAAGADPKLLREKMANDLAISREERASKLELAEIGRETKMMELAQRHNMTLDQLANRLQIEKVRTDSRERTFAAEAALEMAKPAAPPPNANGRKPAKVKGSGGSLAPPGGGSGGYLSGGAPA